MNEFDNLLKQQESNKSQQKSTNVDKSQQFEKEDTKSKKEKELQRKTFYLDADMLKMFKKIKDETGVPESFYLRNKLEEIFKEEYGDNWRNQL